MNASQPSRVSPASGTLIVMAKSPVAGLVKTRLTPAFTRAQAAALAQASLRDTLDTVVAAPARRRVVAWEGPHRSWVPAGIEVIAQHGDGLDERISCAFQETLHGPAPAPALLVGMDTPQLRVADLGLDWDGADAVLGLSPDGGYWALGLTRFHPAVVKGVPMSTDQTGRCQLERLQSLGFRTRILPMMSDVDTPADAAKVARIAPDSRFGRLHRRLTGVECSPMALYDEALDGAGVDVYQSHGAHAVSRGRTAESMAGPS